MQQTVRILLIEDNAGDAFLIKFYLEQSTTTSYHLIHTEFLSSALDLISKNEFDIILLDLNLPDSDGIATLEEVHKSAQDSVVIVLTGLTDEDLGKEALKSGAQDFLVKGQFDGKVLNSSIRFAFERKLLMKEIRMLKKQAAAYDDFFTILRENAEIILFVYDAENNHLKFNSTKPDYFKLIDEEQPYNLYHFLKQVPEDDRKKVEQYFHEASDKKEAQKNEIQFSGSKNKHQLILKANANNPKKIRGVII